MSPGPLRAAAGRDFVREYAYKAPLALALERAMECELYVGRELERPVLDLGCGDGAFAEVLFAPSRLDHGLDPDPMELQHARSRAVYQWLHQAAGSQVPLPSASVSTVLSNSTLEHIPDLDPVLREIFRVLRPGGRLYITVPTDKFDRYSFLYRVLSVLRLGGAAERYRRFYNSFWKHYNYHPPSGWRTRLESAGFSVEEIVEYDPAMRCTIHDLLVPLAFPAYVIKARAGRYFAFPMLRRVTISLLRPLLPGNARVPVSPGTGGLVFLRASRPVEALNGHH